jgi:hypothetical protein
MLTIRKAQFAVFEERAAIALRVRLLEWVKRLHPEVFEGLSPATLGDLVELGVLSAARFGIEKEADLVRFLHLMVELGPTFPDQEEYSWTAKILRDEALAPAERLRMVALFASGSEE